MWQEVLPWRTYLEFPVVELPTRRIVVSQINSDPDVIGKQSLPVIIAFCNQSFSVFFRKSIRDATGNDNHLEAGKESPFQMKKTAHGCAVLSPLN